MPVKAVILKSDRTIKEYKIDTASGEAIIKKGLYVINQDFIQARIDAKTNVFHGSEIFYSEFNASPIPIRPPQSGIYKDPSSLYLDSYIYKNALEQTGDSQVIGLIQGITGIIKPFLEPGNLFKLIFFGAVAYQLLTGVLMG